LTSEGYRSPFIGFISSGDCHVLRKVDVPHIYKKTGVKEKRMKQVVIGKLRPEESFGEISVVLKEPMSCTIVTENECRIGIIPCEKIKSKKNFFK
jgi:CRP-like cAMP-binding protein